ncbi:GIY-YIG nuclease family protein [Dyella dinghuensis]|uniref:GIY-YIG nuclease family protein n=1 Tax=Dyella dinghuensis TaxID=1920169 RepID=A0A432LU14_9GAMM|nr:GIY-YIG nuclease family protein [Dyella dinghuensis]RUL64495.1 GIY-YIG nuclease family protein [Dyella dinghuensis]
MRERIPCVYILANRRNATLYIGVTSDLCGRIWQHKHDLAEGFTKRYSVHDLVWFEIHDSIESAIAREKALKAWNRLWKIQLIEKTNPYWRDLYSEIFE